MDEKILGVGFHKTGTTSLGDALALLGYSRMGWKGRHSIAFHDGKIDDLLRVTDEYQCFEDFPWPLLFAEIHKRHPQTKFILTQRLSMEKWYDSLVVHSDRKPPTKHSFVQYLYGIEHPREKPEHVKAVHQAHIDRVRAYAAEHGVPLLEFCPEKGDGWKELCAFVGKPVPDVPFPHSNKRPSRARLLLGSLRRRLKAASN